MSDLTALFRELSAYNRWANARVYAAAATLSDESYRQPVGLYFSSLHGTLNHMLAADRIWMRRLSGTGEAPLRLDEILFERLDELRHAREAEDGRIQAYVASLSVDDLTGDFSYTTTKGVPQSQTLWSTLTHVFNHQTHHRGQAHAALTRLGLAEPPGLDLILMQREHAAQRLA